MKNNEEYRKMYTVTERMREKEKKRLKYLHRSLSTHALPQSPNTEMFLMNSLENNRKIMNYEK